MPFDPASFPLAQQFQTGPLSPEEEDNLLKKIGKGALGTLGYVGSSLGKAFGGRAIRGALGGKPGELASILPFSDTLGITNPANEVTGEDLLKKWGVLQGEGQKGKFELRDLAGPALEAALDPATFLSPGALTHAGEAALKAGTLERTLAGRIGSGQGGLVGVGLPFAQPSAVLGTGPRSIRFAQGVGKAADAALYSRPGRALSAAFDPNVTLNGFTASEAASQKAFRDMHYGLASAEKQARDPIIKVAADLEKAGWASTTPGAASPGLDLLNRVPELRSVLEGTATPLHPALTKARDDLRGIFSQQLQEGLASGRDMRAFADKYAEYAPRNKTMLDRETRGFGGVGPGVPTRQANQTGRLDALRDIPGGTLGVNELLKDPQISGPNRTITSASGHGSEAQYIRERYLGWTPGDDQRLFTLNQNKPERVLRDPQTGKILFDPQTGAPRLNPAYDEWADLNARWDRSHELARVASSLDPQYSAGKGLDFFGNHPLGDALVASEQHTRAQLGTKAIYQMFAQTAGPAGDGTVPLRKALEQAGLKDHLTAAGGNVGSTSNMASALQGAGKNAPTTFLDDLHVPASIAEEAGRYNRAVTTPTSLKPLLQAWDSITNLTKAGQTSIWPQFHLRNALTGLWQNFVGGAHDPRFSQLNPKAWVQPWLDAQSLRAGKAIEGASEVYKGQGLSDLEATHRLAEEAMATKLRGGTARGLANDVIGRGTVDSGLQGKFQLPGRVPEEGVADILKGAVPRSLADLDPRGIAGVGSGVNRDTNTVFGAGRKLGEVVDDQNRLSAFIALRRQGWEPSAAAEKSMDLHYRYGSEFRTPFERGVLRRAIPFYNWTRNNLPFTLEQLAQHPGGKVSTAIKVSAKLNDKQGGFLPDYLKEGLAIPLGQEANGTQRFLTHFGLPFEDAAGPVELGTNGVQRTLQSVIGQANPLIKLPIELASGKQMMSGRELRDLHGMTGNITLDELLANSPLSRVASTASTLADVRKSPFAKGFNLIGPGKLTDVDMARARSIAERDTVEELLRQVPGVREAKDLYVPKESLDKLDPEQLLLLRLYKTLAKNAQQSKKMEGNPLSRPASIPVRFGGS